MRGLPNNIEVASVVMEQNPEIQKRIPDLVSFARKITDGEGLMPYWRSYIPFTKIIDTPQCAPKTASSILQLADACAFAIKRRLDGKANSKLLTTPFAKQLLRFSSADESDDGKSLWNPRFMPQAWGGMKIDIREID